MMTPRRMFRFSLLMAIGMGLGVAIGAGYGRWYGPRATAGAMEAAKKPTGYHCPMHPNYHSDKPGNCPICGMKLVPDDDAAHPASAEAAADRHVLYYRDPKRPEFKSDTPGLNPETGNDLEPVYADDPSTMPMGTIRVTPAMQQLIGVTYDEATAAAAVHTFRAVGTVAMDETRIARIQPRVEGWIDRVYVDFTGKLVRRGQPLLTLYSPEMLASQQEYLLALRSRDIMADSPLAGARQQSESLVAASRKRLELWELSAAQIDQVTRTGKPVTNVTLHAPLSGYVMTRNAFPKQRITPDTELYVIADLSRVWIMADVFESEAPMIRLGQPAVVTLSYSRQTRLQAKVTYIQPQIDPMTRTLKIRLEAENRDLLLKPDMFVDVDFQIPRSPRLTVPAGAVLDSGLRKTVFVDRGNGFLEPRQVETGEHIGDRVEIVSGLTAGERVVTSGNFLIDSESQLKSAAAGMAGHQHGGSMSPPAQEPPATGGDQPSGAPPAHQGRQR